jgi:TolA-binding protein
VADRLGLANDLRRARRWRDAEAAYLAIATDYPAAPEAYVATLAAAALRLEHLGDPAGALLLYQSSSRRGPLGVEAMFGVARSERALGRPDAEAAALQTVIQAYPNSLQADRARRRLGELRPESGLP